MIQMSNQKTGKSDLAECGAIAGTRVSLLPHWTMPHSEPPAKDSRRLV